MWFSPLKEVILYANFSMRRMLQRERLFSRNEIFEEMEKHFVEKLYFLFFNRCHVKCRENFNILFPIVENISVNFLEPIKYFKRKENQWNT